MFNALIVAQFQINIKKIFLKNVVILLMLEVIAIIKISQI